MPPFLDERLEATPAHGLDENRAVCLDFGTYAAVGEPRARSGKVVKRAHIEFTPVNEPHQRQVDGRTARVPRAPGKVPEAEQVALLHARLVFRPARIVGIIGPAQKMPDGPGRSIAVEHFQPEPPGREIARYRRQRRGGLPGQQANWFLVPVDRQADEII